MEDKVTETHPKDDNEAMDRLRDRTDELELIISSLTIFALFSIPGWLFDKIADIYTHLSTSLVIAAPWAPHCWLAPATDWLRVSSCI